MTRMNTIAVLGQSFLDRILYVAALPTEPSKMRVVRQLETGGGIASTAAVTSARLGHITNLYSRLGDDHAGDTIARLLRANNVDTTGVRRFHNARSPQGTIVVDPTGERMGFGFMGDGWKNDASWLDLKLEHVRAVLADYSWREGASAIFAAARERGAASVLDADINDIESVRHLLPRADHVVFSERCLAAVTGCAEPATGLLEAAKLTNARVSVTVGERGFYWLEGGRVSHLSAFEVQAIDTNGAGDVFHGAYTVAVAEGMSVGDAGRFASATAALKCLKGSGWESIPNRAEVDQFLKGVVK